MHLRQLFIVNQRFQVDAGGLFVVVAFNFTREVVLGEVKFGESFIFVDLLSVVMGII